MCLLLNVLPDLIVLSAISETLILILAVKILRFLPKISTENEISFGPSYHHHYKVNY